MDAFWDKDERFEFLGSNGQSSRSQWDKTCWKKHSLALLMRYLESYWTEFRKLSVLMHFGTKMNPSVFNVFGSSVRPCVRASVRPCVRPWFTWYLVFLCFRDISSICWRIFAKLLSLVRLGTEMNWLDFGVKKSGHGMTECIPDFHVSTISPVSFDGFSPNFCRWCISGQRWPDYVFGSKGLSSRSRHRGGGTQHSTVASSATFSSWD